MRILFANDGFGNAGGVQTYIEATVECLVARGHSIRWLTHDAPSNSIEGSALARQPGSSVQSTGLENALREVAQWSPDVVYSHNMSWLDIEGALRDRWPVVKFMHGYFGTCVSGLKMHASPRPTPCHKTFGVGCLVHYLPRRCGQLRLGKMFSGYQWAQSQQKLFARYQRLVVASKAMEHEYVSNGAEPKNVRCIPLFARQPPEEPQPPLQTARPTVAFAGRMTSLKGGDLLVRAVAMASAQLNTSIRLLMIGDGPSRPGWEQLARQLGVTAQFTGWVDEVARDNFLRDSTLLALPSVWPEPFGLIGLEAARLGVPAIAFDVGGISEWLVHGQNGLLVDGNPPRAESFAHGLVELFSDETRLKSMSRCAWLKAGELSLDRHVDQLETVLMEATGAARTRGIVTP